MKRFTIIELVIVMVIATIIIGMTVATYQKIGSGRQVDTSVAAVASALTRARQMAIANRQNTALLLPGPNVSIENSKRFSAYRIAYVDKTIDASGATAVTTYTFNSYPEDTKWEYTEKACAIMEADGDVGIRSYAGSSTGYIPEKRPVHDDYTTVNDVDLTGLGGGNVDNVRAVVFSKSGKRLGSTQYVTLGEANYFTGRWVIVKPETGSNIALNVSCTNQLTLEVSLFTGAVNYIHPENYPAP